LPTIAGLRYIPLLHEFNAALESNAYIAHCLIPSLVAPTFMIFLATNQPTNQSIQ